VTGSLRSHDADNDPISLMHPGVSHVFEKLYTSIDINFSRGTQSSTTWFGGPIFRMSPCPRSGSHFVVYQLPTGRHVSSKSVDDFQSYLLVDTDTRLVNMTFRENYALTPTMEVAEERFDSIFVKNVLQRNAAHPWYSAGDRLFHMAGQLTGDVDIDVDGTAEDATPTPRPDAWTEWHSQPIIGDVNVQENALNSVLYQKVTDRNVATGWTGVNMSTPLLPQGECFPPHTKKGANLPTPMDVQAPKSFLLRVSWPPDQRPLDPAGGSASRPPLEARSVVHPAFLDLATRLVTERQTDQWSIGVRECLMRWLQQARLRFDLTRSTSVPIRSLYYHSTTSVTTVWHC